MALLLGLATFLSTLLGGLFALRKRDTLHLILGFSAGAVVGVAFFDLLPEAISLASPHYDISWVTAVIAVGFLFYMFLNRMFLLHPHAAEDHLTDEEHEAQLGAGSLSVHSFLDGVGIGLAFHLSPSLGIVVAVAVLVHDFSDGINTVSFIIKHKGRDSVALQWLLIDAIAPLVGVISTYFFTLPEHVLGLVLALFCGFFLYIGASDLLPESQHKHPKMITTVMTLIGSLVIFFAVHVAGL
jgi:zinc transporter ZupT